MRNRSILSQGQIASATTLLLAIMLAGCAGKESKPLISAPAEVDRDGSSFDRAVVITAPNEAMGVNDEYIYIGEQFPGYKETGQALEQSANRSYDVVTIANAGGQTKTVYFDITGFFGKNS